MPSRDGISPLHTSNRGRAQPPSVHILRPGFGSKSYRGLQQANNNLCQTVWVFVDIGLLSSQVEGAPGRHLYGPAIPPKTHGTAPARPPLKRPATRPPLTSLLLSAHGPGRHLLEVHVPTVPSPRIRAQNPAGDDARAGDWPPVPGWRVIPRCPSIRGIFGAVAAEACALRGAATCASCWTLPGTYSVRNVSGLPRVGLAAGRAWWLALRGRWTGQDGSVCSYRGRGEGEVVRARPRRGS